MSIINFLLPSSSLDWFFFILIMIWIIICLWITWVTKNEIKNKIQSKKFYNLTANTSNLYGFLRSPKGDNIVESGAGFALILGLLGTFLGIGLAIQGAGQILADLNNQSSSSVKDLRNTMSSLSPILAEIGMKFKVSAWGIIAHIILRISIPFFKLDLIRQEAIMERLESKHQQELSDRMKFQNSLVDILEELNKNNNDIANKMLVELKVIASAPSKIDDKISILSSATNEFNQTVQNLEKDINQRLLDINKTMMDVLSGSLKVLGDMSQSVSVMKNETQGILGGIQSNILALVNNGENFLGDLNSKIQNILQNLEAITDQKQLEDITKCLNDLVNKVQTMQANLEVNLSSDVNIITQQVRQYLPILQSILDDSDGVEKLSDLIELNKNLEDILRKSLIVHEHIKKDINHELPIISQYVQQYIPTLQSHLGNNSILDARLNNLIQLNENLEDLLKQNLDTSKTINTNILRSNSDKKIRLG